MVDRQYSNEKLQLNVTLKSDKALLPVDSAGMLHLSQQS